ncbi:Uncharacterized conserved protein, DUF885 familyt [Pedobacter sp. ok626]|uniref:DUF885 domain-containing protein n=1 Tax=Pedobacter sp. ok626 TaxID=1761882 RepID=UPI00088BDF4C|nr:DUF885 domain-containing protein [Pedobacter sp. ok626]SDK93631.1 Uncharacterized conserved protein, DUF885 familyt [Pedobacter sp. ok626]
MKKIIYFLIGIAAFAACKQKDAGNGQENKNFSKLCDQYYEEGLKLFPLNATYAGDDRYNDLLPNDGSVQFIQETKDYYTKYLDSLKGYDPEKLNENDRLSYDVLKDELQVSLNGLKYHFEYLPFNQMVSLPLTFGQLGSGTGAQPFKTVKDYDNWLKRVSAFSVWADTAIGNFKKGIQAGIILPSALVVKMYPQMYSMVVTDPKKSLFYDPITNFPKDFSAEDKKRFTELYSKAILNEIIPSYKKMGDFLKNDYLPKARTSSGFSALPDGKAMYVYLVGQQTTTTKSPEEIYQTGLKEVARIKNQMDSIKNKVGFKGDLHAFFAYMRNDPKFTPYKTPKQVLDAFEDIHKRMEPNLKKMFNHVPKTPFEIRQTEAFRAASASAEYVQGSADGKRPGIFYVPILDATKFNITSGMESLFLHEAIPGHHYQISLTQENTSLPKFRRFGLHNAYVEGWALYCESLGKELGLYADPYQHMGALGDEMHRAIRLVVDVAIHTKNMSREQAIKYMMDNEAINEQGATAEIERYMGMPAQALGYKIGAMKIRELRTRYEKELGSKFDLAEFHNQVLKDGSLPLSVFESKMDAWAKEL